MSRVRKSTTYECPYCENWYNDKEMAEECCPPEKEEPTEIVRFQCTGCGELYDDVNEATECCPNKR